MPARNSKSGTHRDDVAADGGVAIDGAEHHDAVFKEGLITGVAQFSCRHRLIKLVRLSSSRTLRCSMPPHNPRQDLYHKLYHKWTAGLFGCFC